MKNRLTNFILYIAALLFALLLFAQNNLITLNSFEHAWNSGHIIAFWLWTHLMLTRWPILAARSHWQQIVISMAIVILISIAVEFIQDAMGRPFSLDDIRKNMLGWALAIFFTIPKRRYLNRIIRIGIQIIVLMAVLFELAPFGRAVIDDIIIYHQYPVLSSFETPFELERWRSNTALKIDRSIKKQGRASLKVNINHRTYTWATLYILARNWSGFGFLELDLYNPQTKEFKIMLAVNDKVYFRNGYKHRDRFVRVYTLTHGWNPIRIPIDEIRTAPPGRELQIKDIREIAVIARQQKKPHIIYIDMIKLSPAS